ncbi:7872_t:CDS:2, partial [Paraglomus brasilianum]
MDNKAAVGSHEVSRPYFLLTKMMFIPCHSLLEVYISTLTSLGTEIAQNRKEYAIQLCPLLQARPSMLNDRLYFRLIVLCVELWLVTSSSAAHPSEPEYRSKHYFKQQAYIMYLHTVRTPTNDNVEQQQKQQKRR